MSTAELIKLSAFSRQVSRMIPPASNIQSAATVEAIADEAISFQSMTLLTQHFTELLKTASIEDDKILGELQKVFTTSLNIVGAYHQQQTTARSSIGDEKSIAQVYDVLAQEISSFYDALSALLWIIGEHIAENDITLPGSYNNADDLFAAIGG